MSEGFSNCSSFHFCRLHISFILDAKRSEATFSRTFLKEDFIGKDLNFVSSSSAPRHTVVRDTLCCPLQKPGAIQSSYSQPSQRSIGESQAARVLRHHRRGGADHGCRSTPAHISAAALLRARPARARAGHPARAPRSARNWRP